MHGDGQPYIAGRMEKLSIRTFQFCVQRLGIPFSIFMWSDACFQAQN
jgi:hypothetical protein